MQHLVYNECVLDYDGDIDNYAGDKCSETLVKHAHHYAGRNRLIYEEKYVIDDDCIIMDKVPLLEENLDRIITNFKNCEESLQQFLTVFPTWDNSRDLSITDLGIIAKDLQKTRFNCNIAKATGSSVGIGGGVVAAVGVALVPFTLGISAALTVGGLVASGAGGATSLGAAFTEIIILKQNVASARNVFQQDQKNFKVMNQWFEHTTAFIESVNEVFEFDVFSKVIADLKKLFSVISKQADFNDHKRYNKSAIRDIVIKFVPGAVCNNGSELISFLIEIIMNPKLRELFKVIIQLHHDNPLIFEAVTMTTRLCLQILRGLDVGTDLLTTSIKSLSLEGMALGASASKVVAQGLLVGLGLAMDVTSLVLTSIDIHKGSKCPYAEQIEKAIEKMKDEQGKVRRIYSALQSIHE